MNNRGGVPPPKIFVTGHMPKAVGRHMYITLVCGVWFSWCFGGVDGGVIAPHRVTSVRLPPRCLLSREYDCVVVVTASRFERSLVFVPCSQTVLDMGLGMRVVPRFRGLRPALCYEGTT